MMATHGEVLRLDSKRLQGMALCMDASRVLACPGSAKKVVYFSMFCIPSIFFPVILQIY